MFRITHPGLTPKSIAFLALSLSCMTAACDHNPVGPDRVQTSTSTEAALLAQIRAATARFHDVATATADGYVRVSPCVYNTPGSKAIHFQKPPLVDALVEPAAPEVLLYEPAQNGELRLVGVEFLIPSAVWDAAHSGIPALGVQPFMDRRSPPFGAPIPNYALYVWVWRHNPSGLFEQYNPNVSCEHADASIIA